MSKRSEMMQRIMDAMPNDAEVQAFCAREIERAGRSAAKTAERLDMAIIVLKNHTDPECDAICAKDFAHEVNSYFPGESWNTRTASYYLRMMVDRKLADVVPTSGKSSPKHYIWF